MRLMSMIAFASVVLSLQAFGQPESENVVHTRHQHPHNPKHATVHDDTRFYTDRISEIQLPLPSEEDAFVFAVFGDRTGGPDSGINILADAVRDVNLFEPDLVMTVGDLIDGYNETPGWMDDMAEYKAVMSNLICPWFPVAGNHDVYWRNETGMTPPINEHEDHYEMHFGPLWYSFAHKNSHFIVLYSDEGNPDTGERTFRKPESQRMSEQQRAFLAQALKRGEDADHIFVFVHHPRWLGGRYGDDWNSVHEMLVEAGNVSAVFAGHIHMMRSDPRDGIEYVTLATVGAHQGSSVPDAGYLHHYNLVTVRKGQVAMAAVPVGEVLDPKDITGELAIAARTLSQNGPVFKTSLGSKVLIDERGIGRSIFEISVDNPTQYPIDYTISLESDDPRWSMSPDHTHGSIEPGASARKRVVIGRPSGGIDQFLDRPSIVLDRELLTDSFRYTIPSHSSAVDLHPKLPESVEPRKEMVFDTQGEWAAQVSALMLRVPDGPLTVECWMNAREFGSRTALLAKTERSEYGIFVSNGRPEFSVFLDGAYATVQSEAPLLQTNTWHHIAGVFDGDQLLLYLDGSLIARAPASGSRLRSDAPFFIGADPNARGEPTSHFNGLIDEVRVSSVARYTGASFDPARRFEPDTQTHLLLHMHRKHGPFLRDESPINNHPWLGKGGMITIQRD